MTKMKSWIETLHFAKPEIVEQINAVERKTSPLEWPIKKFQHLN